MTKVEKRSLVGALSNCVRELSHSLGRFTSGDVVDLLEERYPDVAEAYRERMYRKGMMREACAVMKEMTPRDAYERAIQLPLELGALHLPYAISLECWVKETEEDEVTKVFLWIPLRDATKRELREHMKMIRTGISRDEQHLRDLVLLEAFIQDKISDDQTIGVAFDRQREGAAV